MLLKGIKFLEFDDRIDISHEESIKDDSSLPILMRKLSNFLTSSKNPELILSNITKSIKNVYIGSFLLNDENLGVFWVKTWN